MHEVDRRKWSDFIYNHPNGNIFQTSEMYEVYKYTKNYEPIFLAVINEDNEILGTLLAVIQREYKGPIGDLTARSIIWGAPLVRNSDKQALYLILNEYNKIVRKRALYSQFRNLWDMQNFNEIFINLGYSFEDHLNIIIDLKKPEEILWKEIHPTRRKQIKRASKRGISVQELKNIDNFNKSYQILREVYANAKLPIADKSMFEASFRILAPQEMVKYFGAFNNNEIIGLRYILVFRKTLYDWYAGSLRKYLDKYPNDLLPWEVFKWGKEHGYRTFDFGGAGIPNKPYGVRDYKKKFGGQLVNYGRFEKVHKPLSMQIGKLGFKLYKKIR